MIESDAPRLPGHRTSATRDVLHVLAALPPRQWTYGAQVAELTGGTRAGARLILSRLAAGGWCETMTDTGRPRYYRLSPAGRRGLRTPEYAEWMAQGRHSR